MTPHEEPTLDIEVPLPPRPNFIEQSLANVLASQERVLKLEEQLAQARSERDERIRHLYSAPEELGEKPTMYALAKALGVSKQAVAKIRQGNI